MFAYAACKFRFNTTLVTVLWKSLEAVELNALRFNTTLVTVL